MKTLPDIYPLTIVTDRYSDTYSGGVFTAWNLCACDVPEEINDDDITCDMFWSNYGGIYGIGNTPNEAIYDLDRKMKKRGE